MQLVPAQVEALTVRDLKKRLFADLFSRHKLEVTKLQVSLTQGRKRVPEKTRLADLDNQTLCVRFGQEAKLHETEAVQLLRHRIKNRFRG